ncbi:hypothetical protein A0H81_11790 [Grifola frondosa]|uniref:Uncharacterized protein n=1 Tax=Grifola frondosa TaxID=5627 RepID=A0A1C7LZC3_GRIFR|nr:hypothetical protein A0H81_11790 [Grifola frondosa]
MEATSPLPIPRLRLTRHLPQPISDDYLAPPSPNSRSQNDEDEDTDTTPRLSTSAMPDAMSPRATSTSNPPAETPAARLGLCSLAFRITLFARESLRELFSRALRDSTPRKNRPRRNSIDTSEVDATPRVEQVREKIKSKRRSMSDEEAEKSTVDDSEPSFPTPSAASTYNALRQRLDRSSSVLPSLAPERMMTDMSMPPADSGEETPASPPQGVVMSDANPSHTSATSMRSLQMSTQLQMQSNLLEQDSEMQKALGGMDSSFESDHAPHPRPVAFPSISTKTHTSPARELSWDSHHRSHSIHKLPIAQRPSDDLSSRASSSHSEDKDLHDRERGWNQPGPKSPSHSFSSSSHIGLGKPSGLTLTRRSSGASSHSFEDGRSSQASSLTSRSEIRDRMRELEEERNKEREREWNRNHTLFRSASNLSMESQQERRRTNSQPTRSDSADLYSTPGRLEGISMYRHSSSGSMSSSGRASSAMSSRSMERERDMIMEDEQIHKRERDWSAPRARWQDERRTVSPLPCSSAGSPSHTHRASLKADSPRSSPKGLPDRSKSPSGFGETVNGWGSRDKAALRPMSPLTRSAVETESAGAHPRPRSPLPPQTNSDTGPVDYRSRFGWHFPQHRTPLPPLELEQDTPEKRATPPPRPPSRTSGMIRNSHLPVRSPRSTEKATSPSPSTDRTEHKRRHRRSLTEFTESLGTVPPLIKVESVEPIDITPEDVHHDDLVFASDEDSLPATSTPTTKLEPLPAEDRIPRPPASPLGEPSINVYRMNLRNLTLLPRLRL